MSQIFYIGLGSIFRKYRKNSYPFFFLHKMKTKTFIKNLRHSSLWGNVIYMYTKS